MYPPERRARGIALVLFGAVFGAILGPAVFSPLLADRELDGDGARRALARRGRVHARGRRADAGRAAGPAPDRPAAGAGADGPEPPAAPLAELLRRPGVMPALLAAQASFSVMVGLMTLTGAVVVDHQHHMAHDVFPIIGAHVLGMYALVLVIGDLIDRIGRTPALAGGLVIMAGAALSLEWVMSVPATAAALFCLGIGWNLSFVAATAELADCSRALGAGQAARLQRPAERADRAPRWRWPAARR